MQRVLIIESHLLVGGGVLALLNDRPNLDVRGIATNRRAELVQEIDSFQPDVIILDEDSHLLCRTLLLPLTHKLPKLRILVVSANIDRVRIFEKTEPSFATISQFINLVQK